MTPRVRPGDIIDERYALVELLGTGSHATVWRATQLGNARNVALKILRAQLNPTQREQLERRFVREAQALAAIAHPNVVTVFDFGFCGAERKPFMVIDPLEGYTLARLLMRDGALPFDRARTLMSGALEALGEAHERGIVHKDLKPENLFITSSGARERMVLLDFGVAMFCGHERLTTPGMVMGTPQYLPPEYLTRGTVTPAFDVYQMGLILAEMLTGTPLVVGHDPMACFEKVRRGAYALPDTLSAQPVGAVLRNAIAHDHTQRYPDADVFRDALLAL